MADSKIKVKTINDKVRSRHRFKFSDYLIIFVCILITLVCVLPLINLLAKSLSGSDYLVKGEVYLIPKGFTTFAYKTVLSDKKYIWAFWWTVILTVVGTLLSLFMTACCAYPLIYPKLKGRGVFNIIITITMFFNAGTIPNYLLMKSIGFLDNPLSLIIPSCLSVFNMIIMRSFFYQIPELRLLSSMR